jgi:hypothetical protein
LSAIFEIEDLPSRLRQFASNFLQHFHTIFDGVSGQLVSVYYENQTGPFRSLYATVKAKLLDIYSADLTDSFILVMTNRCPFIPLLPAGHGALNQEIADRPLFTRKSLPTVRRRFEDITRLPTAKLFR